MPFYTYTIETFGPESDSVVKVTEVALAARLLELVWCVARFLPADFKCIAKTHRKELTAHSCEPVWPSGKVLGW